MPDLIPLHNQPINAVVQQTVNARALHEFLGVRTEFRHWIRRRIDHYGFLQNVDFISRSEMTIDNPTPQIDYHITLGMAKELAMVERTDQGKRARLYFIECERMAKHHPSQPSLAPLTTQQLDAAAYLEAKQKLDGLFGLPLHLTLTEGVKEIRQHIGLDLSQKLLSSPHMDDVPDDHVYLEIADICKKYTLPKQVLNPLLAKHGYQVRIASGVWEPTAQAKEQGLCSRHAWVNGHKSGVNWKWRLPFAESVLRQEGFVQ